MVGRRSGRSQDVPEPKDARLTGTHGPLDRNQSPSVVARAGALPTGDAWVPNVSRLCRQTRFFASPKDVRTSVSANGSKVIYCLS